MRSQLQISKISVLVLFAVTALFLINLGQASATPVLVTSRADLSGTDYVDWGSLGAPYTTVNHPFTIISADGVSMSVTMPSAEKFERRDQTTGGWGGNFAPGDHLLWTQTSTSDLNPIALFDFSNGGIHGGGAQIQPDYYGPFTAQIQAFDVTGNLLGSFTLNGFSNSAADNSAIFIGIEDTDALIGRISIGVTELTWYPSGPRADFAINQFDFDAGNPMPSPEPSSILLLGTGMCGLAFAARKRAA